MSRPEREGMSLQAKADAVGGQSRLMREGFIRG